MATSTLYTPAKPVNQAAAVSALKVATAAVDAAQEATAKLLAMRKKELERLRAETDHVRSRIETLDRQTRSLHDQKVQALQRTSMATSALRNCPRRLPRSMSFAVALVVAGVTAWVSPAVAKPPATDAVYVCEVEGKLPIYLNLSTHRFRFAGQTGPLHEGLQLNFTTRAGYTVYLKLGNLDRLHDNRPTYVEGTATVSKDGDASAPESAFCTLSGAARAKKQVVAKSEGSVQALKDKWFNANLSCRGSYPGKQQDRACALRDRLDKQLEARGQCFAVEKTETSTESVWRKCP
jgi:hypothetical protein